MQFEFPSLKYRNALNQSQRTTKMFGFFVPLIIISLQLFHNHNQITFNSVQKKIQFNQLAKRAELNKGLNLNKLVKRFIFSNKRSSDTKLQYLNICRNRIWQEHLLHPADGNKMQQRHLTASIVAPPLTLLQDIAIVHWNRSGVSGTAVQDQACRPSISKP